MDIETELYFATYNQSSPPKLTGGTPTEIWLPSPGIVLPGALLLHFLQHTQDPGKAVLIDPVVRLTHWPISSDHSVIRPLIVKHCNVIKPPIHFIECLFLNGPKYDVALLAYYT